MLAGGVDLAGAGGGELGADLGDEPVLDREVADEPGGARQFSNAEQTARAIAGNSAQRLRRTERSPSRRR